jgi:3-phosphoshikimate 1-carboxyvinyltransferase
MPDQQGGCRLIIITSPPAKLRGELTVPGDKSITHRAVMFGAISRGVTEVKGFLDAEDCHSTIRCLQAMGATISIRGDRLLIEGSDLKLKTPSAVLDAGNSGTTARLLLGLLAGQPFEATVTGDQSLKQRPMKRVVDPLKQMGAVFTGEGETLPLTIRGGAVQPIEYRSPKASAQVKSAVLLAGLYADGVTTLVEPYLSRNHTELMLAYFGANVKSEGNKVSLKGRALLRGNQVKVPADISAAAFFMVAAAIIPGAEILLRNVGVNPTRTGIIDALQQMGAEVKLENERLWGYEPVADILVTGGKRLNSITIGGALIPRLIDEIPVLAVAAAVADGETVISNAAELRVKESDRIAALAGEMRKLGVRITEKEDGMIIHGGYDLIGAEVDSCGDHRIAMALAVAGLAAGGETAVRNAEAINISFPGFMAALRSLTLKKWGKLTV